MNLLQTFMADAKAQARAIIAEEFTIVGQSPSVVYFGVFGTPQIIPVMVDNGYQDHLVIPVKAEVAQPNGAFPTLSTLAHGSLIRTQTARTLFIQAIDYTDPVSVTFLCTDRTL